MSSSLSAFSGLKPNTLPIIDAVRLAIDPGSNSSRSYATKAVGTLFARYHPFRPFASFPISGFGRKSAPEVTMKVHIARPAGDKVRSER
jgi:hypothetical protein